MQARYKSPANAHLSREPISPPKSYAPMTDHTFFPATRETAFERANDFASRMGRDYSDNRNIDRGVDKPSTVSKLSPHIRRRLITEQELALLALETHGAKASAKFVQEVVWRTYWKGWLEHRPTVWDDYVQEVADDRDSLANNSALRKAYDEAVDGRTGIDCFDAWAQELVNTNYLHNHARMSFASIWVHTLRLPWALGADFFYHHLLDGDPASNTLSWRWVAGLHTAGKAYVADPGAIKFCSDGRFAPRKGELADEANAPDDPDLPEKEPLRQGGKPKSTLRTALLITEDDCHVEDLIDGFTPTAIATFKSSNLRTADGAAEAVAKFETQALADQAARLTALGHPEMEILDEATALLQWCADHGIEQLVMPMIPCGPTLDALRPTFDEMRNTDVAIAELQRDWDALIWPHATAGFFKVKKQMPRFMQKLTPGYY